VALNRTAQAVGGGEGDTFFGEEEVVDEEEGEDGSELGRSVLIKERVEMHSGLNGP